MLLHPLELCCEVEIIMYAICISEDDPNTEKSNSLKRKVAEEKRQRDHILQLNQILAKQVMEKSKMVAGTNYLLQFMPLEFCRIFRVSLVMHDISVF
jgi:hypothetical protein